ncbi:recombinase family protein [Sphingomonas solaris]|uniref:Recombinase family protein n=1 Tax=Alterirhizorhabdus solaris TaxID=2529389 RepID=A0A558R9G3_9SPHN|nr:recombinase family protein [Sphingomonas solaris]TVV76031.1 recombinase family protein [Sphingomonas solaris]
MLIGYARVSSAGQSLNLQLEALRSAGCEKIYSEKRSGRSAADRPELSRALDQMRTGDTFIVTRLDRLARSLGDLHRLVERMIAEGVEFRCLQQGGVDTSTSTGKLLLGILGSVAEFENDIRRERQRDGIEKAKAEGRYNGRPATIDADAIRKLKADGVGAGEIAKQLRIGRASVYRVLVADKSAAVDA